MRLLWIVNMLLPDAADYLGVQTGSSGTWMIDISHMLAKQENTELAIACVYGKKFRKFSTNGITYYCLPGSGKNMLTYTKKYENVWRNICNDFRPDIVHLHGTEYSHGLSFLRVFPDVPAVVSIQGVLTRIKDVDFAGVPLKEYIFGRTFRQNTHLNGEIELHFLHKRNARYEQEILRRVRYINGVNTWDISLCRSINPDLTAFQLEYNLRDGFYNSSKWDISSVERHSIFTNPGGTPLKGLHKLIEAMALLKPKYPDIRIYVPGMSDGKGNLAVTGAYAKYIGKLIKKHKIKDNIIFLGRLNEQEMIERMLRAHVVVIPSAIEGTSMILREAMYLGCPCIASFRGGMADFISDKQDGFLYDFQEYPYLATRLSTLFESDDLCARFSENAIIKAEAAHDRRKNADDYKKMYDLIYSKKKEDMQ